eukprot:5793955-Pleurochrysis_carterae.AAC.1
MALRATAEIGSGMVGNCDRPASHWRNINYSFNTTTGSASASAKIIRTSRDSGAITTTRCIRAQDVP